MVLFRFPEETGDATDIGRAGRFWGENAYYYHDTPDGQDLFKKMKAITRDIGCVSTVLGVMYGKEALHNKSNILAAVETFKVAYPPVLAGATFALVSHQLVQIQGKSGHWNYFWSGFAAGIVMSAGFKTPFWGSLQRSIYYGILGAMWYQLRIVEGFKWVSDDIKLVVRDSGYPQSKEFFDWTFTKDVPKRDW